MAANDPIPTIAGIAVREVPGMAINHAVFIYCDGKPHAAECGSMRALQMAMEDVAAGREVKWFSVTRRIVNDRVDRSSDWTYRTGGV